eukprot:1906489-Pyramimonas_sp.AAC.1
MSPAASSSPRPLVPEAVQSTRDGGEVDGLDLIVQHALEVLPELERGVGRRPPDNGGGIVVVI